MVIMIGSGVNMTDLVTVGPHLRTPLGCDVVQGQDPSQTEQQSYS